MIFEKVKEIIVEELGVEESEVQLEASFQEDLGADSLDLFEMVMSFEEEFDVEIPNEDLENIKTVNDCVEYIKSKKA
ncbi:acyl carrier protein [Natranaerovirga hydrolytica]|uniref:Acyl carrier protein n=1 Tax=Natranaerovirga hydrolytica TaxID=680378 RepID=A0A4R1M7C2_9FIRM|nr:acyl carrier protein [Natranaerovirga hydrolytica]TCK86744.1 acyl carrier protein [Natranaerovirga hydrolytica]